MPKEPIGGMYRKLQVGLEQAHRTSFSTGHILWQDRLKNEARERDKHQKDWYKTLGSQAPQPLQSRMMDIGPEPDLYSGRISRDRILWRDQPGPGSFAPDEETVAGRLQAERLRRHKLAAVRGLAASLSESNLKSVKAKSGTSGDWALEAEPGNQHSLGMITAELPLRHHEISARQWRSMK
mmetsp:Transcript_22225/g.40043  ORF Transcript_22225/g.40043 Transcript_22225/m.40043 type:complete len:181 (+) Transcript_22225:41-583(+)